MISDEQYNNLLLMMLNLFRSFKNWIKCKFGYHDRNIEDLGGVIYEVCDNCPWVGRHHIYEEIQWLNKT